MIKYNISTVVNIRSVMVCVRSTSKRWFLAIVQVTIKHDLFDARVGHSYMYLMTHLRRKGINHGAIYLRN